MPNARDRVNAVRLATTWIKPQYEITWNENVVDVKTHEHMCCDNIVTIDFQIDSMIYDDFEWKLTHIRTQTNSFRFSILSMISNRILVCHRTILQLCDIFIEQLRSKWDRDRFRSALSPVEFFHFKLATHAPNRHFGRCASVSTVFGTEFGKSCAWNWETKWLPKGVDSILFIRHVISILINVPRKTCTELQTKF